MEKTLTEALNTLPRLSFRWLGLNHFSFQDELKVSIKPYTHPYLPADFDSSLILQAIPGSLQPNELLQPRFLVYPRSLWR